MAVIGRVEIDVVDGVDHLPQQRAILHVVVGISKGHADQAADFVAAPGHVLQLGQQRIVDEVKQRAASNPFRIRCPGRPAQMLGNRRLEIIAQLGEFFLPIVKNFQAIPDFPWVLSL
jgi:hypothetical protein